MLSAILSSHFFWAAKFEQRFADDLWGGITVGFVGVEQFFDDEIDVTEEEEAWDPLTLLPVDDPNRINRFELITGIIAAMIGIGIFVWVIAPDGVLGWLVAEDFRPNIAWLVASTCIDLAVKLAVLWNGRWDRPTRWLEIGADVFGLHVIYRIVSSPEISTIAGVTIGLKVAFTIALIAACIGLIIKLVRLLWNMQFGQTWRWHVTFSNKTA